MGDVTQIVTGQRWRGWRIAMWDSAAFLLLPAIAMRFTSQVDWDGRDFITTGIMLAGACATCELAARASGNGAYRAGAEVAVATAFLTVWANLAVGMIGDEGNGAHHDRHWYRARVGRCVGLFRRSAWRSL